jgi:phosphatidylglycerol lysyltransferase
MQLGASPTDRDRARDLVLRYGWNTTAYQILNPGFEHWFDPSGEGVAGICRARGVWVVGGAPVAPASALGAVTARLEAAAAADGSRVCYLAAQERLVGERAEDPAATVVPIGAEPCWDPRRWPEIIDHDAGLRAQLARARNKGVEVRSQLGTPSERIRTELREVLRDWLGRKGLPPLAFLTTPWLLEDLTDRQLVLAERGGVIVGFAVLTPVPGRNGWLLEQIVRRPEAPNGTSEVLVDGAFRAIAAQGAEFASLGIVPLSRRAPPDSHAPVWLRLALGWARAHGRRFYNFEGLDRFKAKLRPHDWHPVHLVANAQRPGPGLYWGVLGAVLGGSPGTILARAAARAIAVESQALWRGVTRRRP